MSDRREAPNERMTRAQALAAAAQRLAAVSPTARLDAELLMAHALGTSRDALLLAGLAGDSPAGFAPLVARRLASEPVAYITGSRGFWTIELQVGPGVLVPRADSETLMEAAVDHFAGRAGPARILDLGTGSGALLLAALDQWPHATGVGIDAAPDALRWAARNARALALDDRAILREGGWADGEGAFDLVLCNPPYVERDADLPPEVREWEPASALFAGTDGLDDYRAIAPLLAPRLAPGGCACIEIGHAQGASAAALFRAHGLAVAVRRDLGGRDRCLLATLPPKSGV